MRSGAIQLARGGLSLGQRRLGGLRHRWILALACVLGTFIPLGAQEASEDDAESSPGFQVVINAANPTESMTASTVAKIFLKKLRRWDHDETITPIDLGAKDPVRKAFTRAIHGKSVTAIKSFWQRMIFSARGQPPEEKSDHEEVLEFIRTTPGGIGYVSDDITLGDGVKELKITQ
ncbi:MAG: hypothetical protein AAF560_10925 [Acidobacteriota bacterium]